MTSEQIAALLELLRANGGTLLLVNPWTKETVSVLSFAGVTHG